MLKFDMEINKGACENRKKLLKKGGRKRDINISIWNTKYTVLKCLKTIETEAFFLKLID